jgi:hypothetical protein
MPQRPAEIPCEDSRLRGDQGSGRRLLQYVKPYLIGLSIILLFGFVLIQGVTLLAFGVLDGREGAADRVEDNRINALIPWSKVMGVRSQALVESTAFKAMLGAGVPFFDRIKPDLEALLAIRPMLGRYWVLFAEARMAEGEPVFRALPAFEMAELTAPYERQVMIERIRFGLGVWELLLSGSRARIVSNLIAIKPYGDETARTILGLKNERVRADVRTRLEQAGADVTWLEQLGL